MVKIGIQLTGAGLPHNYINCLFVDRTGKVWITTPGSTLAYIQDEKVVKISLNSVSGNLTLGPIIEDSDSRIWVGSNGNGVFMIQSDSIVNLTAKEGLLSNYCYSLTCDDHKNIWVGHKNGLSRIRTTDYSVKPIQHIKIKQKIISLIQMQFLKINWAKSGSDRLMV